MLPFCLVVAALIHIGAMFLFDVVYPPGTNVQPRMGEVEVLFTDSQEYTKIAAWLAGNDPALLSATYVPDSDLEEALHTPYQPTFDSASIHLQPPPVPALKKTFSEIILPQDMISNVVGDNPEKRSLSSVQKHTQIEFQDDLAGEIPVGTPMLPPVAPQGAESTTFLAGVLPDGRIGFLFPQNNASTELDQKASDYIEGLQMKPVQNQKIRWGNVVIHWGIPATPAHKP